MSPSCGRPETASPERDLLRVVVPRLHRDHVQDGRPVEESHFPRLHSPPRQVAHLCGGFAVAAALLLPLLDRHLHLRRSRYLLHCGSGRVVGREGLVDAS